MTHPKHASSDHDILDVIRRRWSPRAFDPDRSVDLTDLRSLFEAARWAASSFNEQPWRFIVADRFRTPEHFQAIFDTLANNNRSWAQHAPILVVVAAFTQLSRISASNRHAWYDAGQAVALLSIQATSLDLGVRQMEGFDRESIRVVCRIPGDHEPVVVMAIGYPGDPGQLEIERHRLAEQQPRQRQSIDQFVFAGRWGEKF